MNRQAFFLSSKFGSNKSADGSSFDVELERALEVPAGARATCHVHSADVPYCFFNVSAAQNNNQLILGHKHAAMNQWFFNNPATSQLVTGTTSYAATYKVSFLGSDYTYTLIVTPAQLTDSHTLGDLRDTLNQLSTDAMVAAHPTLDGESALVLSALSATPVKFKKVADNAAVDSEIAIAALGAKTQIYAVPDAADAGEVLAVVQQDSRGIRNAVDYHVGGTTYANLQLLYKNPTFIYKGGQFYSTSTAPERAGSGTLYDTANTKHIWSATPAGTTYATITFPDGLYDVVSLNTALQTAVATLAAGDTANGTAWGSSS